MRVLKTPRRSSLLAALLCVGLLGLASTSAASAAVSWRIDSQHGPQNFAPGGVGEYAVQAINEGTTDAEGYEISLQLPPGVTATAKGDVGLSSFWDCGALAGQSTVTCTLPSFPFVTAFAPKVGEPPAEIRGAGVTLLISVAIDPGVVEGSTGDAIATVSGGAPGTDPVSVTDPTAFSSTAAGFGLVDDDFVADAFDGSTPTANPDRQAGSHPSEARFNLKFNLKRPVDPLIGAYTTPEERPRNIVTKLPKGFIGNTEATPKCTAVQLAEPGSVSHGACPVDSQIGTIDLLVNSGQVVNELFPANVPNQTLDLPVFNMAPAKGVLADFGFVLQRFPIHIIATLDSADHYAVKATITSPSELFPVRSARLSLWGVPADSSHDALRLNPLGDSAHFGTAAGVPRKPFLTLPTNCLGPESIALSTDSWQHPGLFKHYASEPAQMNGCNQLDFNPTIEARPTTNLADSPSGLDVDLHVPQNEDPDGRAVAHLKEATVTLPKGLTVNASSADGLGACSPEQIGLTTPVGEPAAVFDGDPQHCPDASKLGTMALETPVLDHPLGGSVYLATPHQNPFSSLLALYLVIEDPRTGVIVKLPGRVDANAESGQLSTTFRETPQLPFEDLRVNLFGGPRASLKTPATCGSHITTTNLTPWSSPEGANATPSGSFELTGGAGGGVCQSNEAAAPNAPSFSAGTLDPTAKAFSPFVLKLARADGTQQIKAIDTTLPQGLVAKLAGTTYCPDAALAAAAGKSGKAEQGAPSCPASSHVGVVNVGAGAGSTPLYVQSQAYLAGPYKGAPLSLAIITPAVAGPFDLGVVVVRTALYVNPETAQVRAVSDEIPQILQGIPLNVRSIALRMDRPSFTLNPTSCDPMSVDGSALTVFGQSAPLTNHFQVGECSKLGFKPKLQMRFSGPTKRSAHPKLRAVLTARPGDANIARAQVTLPKTELLAQSHIRTICTRVQYAAKSCPKGAIYGYAKAWTPLLDQPLEGPVYLRSSSNKLPDLVADLNGQLEVDLIGRIDAVKAKIRNTFELVPDAPVSKFVLTMQGGGKGLLVNNTNLCKAKPRLQATFEAQNGKVAELTPLVKTDCGKKGRGGKGKRGGQK